MNEQLQKIKELKYHLAQRSIRHRLKVVSFCTTALPFFVEDGSIVFAGRPLYIYICSAESETVVPMFIAGSLTLKEKVKYKFITDVPRGLLKIEGLRTWRPEVGVRSTQATGKSQE